MFYLEEDDDPGRCVVVGAVRVDQTQQVHQGRKERSDVGELLHLQVLEVGGQRLEVSGDVLRLLHGRHHVPVHGLEGGVVGGVREVEDAGHLDRNI